MARDGKGRFSSVRCFCDPFESFESSLGVEDVTQSHRLVSGRELSQSGSGRSWIAGADGVKWTNQLKSRWSIPWNFMQRDMMFKLVQRTVFKNEDD